MTGTEFTSTLIAFLVVAAVGYILIRGVRAILWPQPATVTIVTPPPAATTVAPPPAATTVVTTKPKPTWLRWVGYVLLTLVVLLGIAIVWTWITMPAIDPAPPFMEQLRLNLQQALVNIWQTGNGAYDNVRNLINDSVRDTAFGTFYQKVTNREFSLPSLLWLIIIGTAIYLIWINRKKIAAVASWIWTNFSWVLFLVIFFGLVIWLIRSLEPSVTRIIHSGPVAGFMNQYVVDPNDRSDWDAPLPGWVARYVNPDQVIVMRGPRNNQQPLCAYVGIADRWAEHHDISTPEPAWGDVMVRGATIHFTFSDQLKDEMRRKNIPTAEMIFEVRDATRTVGYCEYP